MNKSRSRSIMQFSLFVALFACAVLLIKPAILDAQPSDELNHGFFNIAPIDVSNSFLYPQEATRFEALKEVVDILGQEDSFASILEQLAHGKGHEDVNPENFSELEELKKRNLAPEGLGALNQAEEAATRGLYWNIQNQYSKTLFNIADRPLRTCRLMNGGFSEIVLLKERFFGDKIVLISSDGYVELSISGDSENDSLSDRGDVPKWNRIVKATIVTYEDSDVPVLYFDQTGKLRELVYRIYDRPYDFYDVQSENDLDKLALMKKEGRLDYYVNYFADSLPIFSGHMRRHMAWDENGRLAQCQETPANSNNTFYLKKNYFKARYEPTAASKRKVVNLSTKYSIPTKGVTDYEKTALSNAVALIAALNGLQDVYRLEEVALKNELFHPNDAKEEARIKFASFRAVGEYVFMRVGDSDSIFYMQYDDAAATSKNDDRAGDQESNDVLSHICVYSLLDNKTVACFFNKRREISLLGTTTRLDVENKSYYKSYPHDCCRFTLANPENGDFLPEEFRLPGAPAILHIARFETKGTFKEKFYDTPKQLKDMDYENSHDEITILSRSIF